MTSQSLQLKKRIILALFALSLSLRAAAGDLPITSILNADGTVKPNIETIVNVQNPATFVNEYGEPIFTTADDIAGQVYHMVVLDGKLYVGGRFEKADRRVVNNVAVWDGTKWSGLAKGVDGPVKAMCAMGKDLVVAGDFSYVDKSSDNPGIEANRIARWDGKKWNIFSKLNIDREIFALAFDGKTLYIGGNFTKLEGKTDARSVAMWDGKGWKPVGGSKFDKSVIAMTCVGNTLYVGGFFSTIGDEPAAYVAMWDGKEWMEVGKKGLNNDVTSLANDGKNVYAAGRFFKSGTGEEMRGVAKWDGTKWSQVGGGFNEEAYTVSCADGKVCISGAFYKAGGKDTGGAVVWDGNQLSTIPKMNNLIVRVATYYNGQLYIGGSFVDVPDETLRGNILKFDGSKYEPLSK
ncbi:MAG: hypothetical protein SNJ55_05330 [Chloroherpetonaceae bacterium]